LIVAGDRLRQEEIESRWEAGPAVGLVIAFQLLLALISRSQDWKLSGLPWWVCLISIGPQTALLIPLAWHRPRRRLEQMGHRRTVALALLGVVSLTNALLLVALIASLIKGDEKSGGQLLLKAVPWPLVRIQHGSSKELAKSAQLFLACHLKSSSLPIPRCHSRRVSVGLTVGLTCIEPGHRAFAAAPKSASAPRDVKRSSTLGLCNTKRSVALNGA
jgi:hypothetical protein